MGNIPPLTPAPMSRPDRVDARRTEDLDAADSATQQSIKTRKLRKAAQDFESLFLHKLIQGMRATVPRTGDHDAGMETMRDITDQQLAVHLAQQGGIGLGDMVFGALQRQHVAAPDTAAEPSPAGSPTDEQPPVTIRPLTSDASKQRENTGY